MFYFESLRRKWSIWVDGCRSGVFYLWLWIVSVHHPPVVTARNFKFLRAWKLRVRHKATSLFYNTATELVKILKTTTRRKYEMKASINLTEYRHSQMIFLTRRLNICVDWCKLMFGVNDSYICSPAFKSKYTVIWLLIFSSSLCLIFPTHNLKFISSSAVLLAQAKPYTAGFGRIYNRTILLLLLG